ncbi:Histone-lysine N-methyltransferase SMYD3 [Nymphon striatum]|nr:Histone-lysine N-methyltransferase SMYD3 [Nymphon striatum]
MEKGSVVLNSKPFVYILCNSHRGRHCDSCLASNDNLLKCVSCSFVYYCNRKCQKKAWNLHKLECAALKKVHPYIPTDSVRLIAQIIFKLKLGGAEEAEETGDGKKRMFADLESHVEEISADEKRRMLFSKMCSTLKIFLGEDNIPSPLDLLSIFGKMVINSLTITTGDLRSVGVGLYLGLSRFNHSCKPNAAVNFEGTTAAVRTITDLPSKDLNQIFITYIDQLCDRSERRKSLRDQYYFTCQCDACNDPNHDAKMTKILKTDGCDKIIEKLSSIQSSNSEDDAMTEQSIKCLRRIVGDAHQYSRRKRLHRVSRSLQSVQRTFLTVCFDIKFQFTPSLGS